jgi:TPR repeat protein
VSIGEAWITRREIRAKQDPAVDAGNRRLRTIMSLRVFGGIGMCSLVCQTLKGAAAALRRLALAVSLAMAGTFAALADDLSDGLAAYQARDFATALKHFRKAAEEEAADAQLHLGAMYFNGHGVAQDRDEAARWFHKAALRGNLEAQHILGVIYWDGRGVTRNYVSSYMWFDIASQNGSKSAADSVRRIAANLSSPDISEAKRRAQACLASNYRNCD